MFYRKERESEKEEEGGKNDHDNDDDDDDDGGLSSVSQERVDIGKESSFGPDCPSFSSCLARVFSEPGLGAP